jgi:hypothetical protein
MISKNLIRSQFAAPTETKNLLFKKVGKRLEFTWVLLG